MRKKESIKKKDDEIELLYQSVSRLWHTLKYIQIIRVGGA